MDLPVSIAHRLDAIVVATQGDAGRPTSPALATAISAVIAGGVVGGALETTRVGPALSAPPLPGRS